MATGSLPAANVSSAPIAGHVERDRYIERQLNATRRQVKLVELGAAGVTMLVGVLAFFFLAALVDHWLMPLGYWGRGAALALLIGGALTYAALVIWPLLRNSINPAYAALTIEHSAPSLKNSLINFLMLRSQRSDVHDVVYEAVEARAASDLSQVPLDSVIDYSKLIKIGYVLAGVFAICAAYKVMSPKDPLQTMARVALPWADIARPSRVQIDEVLPGDAPKFFGETVEVAATLRGVRPSDRIQLIYSTLDGQTIDKPVDMVADDAGRIYKAKLPIDGQGLVQDLKYRVAAGDAVSRDFHLQVLASPTIVVHKLQYDFPRYTQKPTQIIEQTGDIRALEGTKVTVHAKANQPIHAAYIEFDPGQDDKSPEATLRRQRVQLEASGTEASGSFVLELAGDRATSKYGSYQITFMTEAGHAGQHPAQHTIDVIRDLPPEVEILTPTEQAITVPANGEQVVEVRAVDADFALSRVSLKLTRGAAELAEEILLNPAQGHVGQSVSKFKFRPAAYKLQAGDEVVLWAIAADNRTAPKSGLAEPNTERTKNYIVKIGAPDPTAKTSAENDGQNEQPPMPMEREPKQKPEPKNNPQAKPGEQGQEPNEAGKNENQPNENPSEKPGENDKPETSPMNAGKMKPEKPEQEKPQPNQPQPNKNEQENMGEGGSSSQQQNGAGGKSEKPMPGEQNGENDKPGEQGQAGNKPKPGDKSIMGEQPQEGQEPNDADPMNKGQNQKQGPGGKQPMPGEQQNPENKGQENKNNKKPPSQNDKPQDAADPANDNEEGATNGQAGSQAGKADTPMTGGSGKSEPNSKKPQAGGAGQGSEPGGNSQAGGNQPGEPMGTPTGNNTPNEKNPGEKNPGTQNGTPEQGRGQGPGEQSRRDQQVPPGERENPHDGEAFEKALERLKKAAEERAKNGAGGEKPMADGQRSPDEKLDPELLKKAREFFDKQQKENAAGQKPEGQTPESLKDSAKGGNQQGEPSGSSETSEQPKNEQPMGAGGDKKSAADKKQGSGASNERGQGDPGKPDNKANAKPEETGGKEAENKEKRQGSMGTNGESGSGRESQDKKGSPQAQEENKDRSKEAKPDDQKPSGAQEAQSPSTSKRQSHSKSSEGGDRSGGGKQGGGQGGNAPGNDKAGSNSVADEGAGAASEQGEGDTGKKGGDQKQTDKKTGQPGQEQGAGSQTRKDPRGDKAGKSDDNDPMQPGEKSPQPPPGGSGAERAGGGGHVNGGGQLGDQQGESPLKDAEVPPAEKAKIDYARQATDLVIEYLKDQKEQPDQELLNELGWSQEDLKQFLSRWEAAKREAAGDKKSEQELNEALRSLGLRPQNDKLRRAEVKSDNVRGLGDVGPTSGPPSKYLEQFRAFKKGAARGK